ncbi:hypothetical protein NP493_173g00020 [Ridgeia piscesae]|uniref:5-aminolevulinate synthase presequence domain-containing protein n=1 Tax=Ridgeia piscesae TaxID=27915 RepID=A0AAD9P322_RIDPI|nr:hypothetical protein NP493_173g00020 [Ridgeia piscesae]
MFRLTRGVMKALKCPFLTRIPIGQVKQHASELLTFADHCPVMGHVMRYSVLANNETPILQGMWASNVPIPSPQPPIS